MYMPTLARFTARDPMPPDGEPVLFGGLPNGLSSVAPYASHPYGYASNNPLAYTDPSGLQIQVIAIEGAGAKGNEGLRLLEQFYKPIADKYAQVTWRQYFQTVTDLGLGAGKIAKQIDILAKAREADCQCCYSRIVMIGFSWGGNSVLQVLQFLANQVPPLKVDAVLTIDPVFGNPSTSKPVAANFNNYCSWTSFYQTTDTNTMNLGFVLGRHPIVGDPITGAANSQLTDLGKDNAHLKIAADPRPINTFDSILNDYLRGSGPRRKDWKGDCPIPACLDCND